MTIDYRVIPHNQQRYPTCGDWWWGLDRAQNSEPCLFIRVSKFTTSVYQLLIFLHELIEAMLCQVSGAESDSFDIQYEWTRKYGRALCGCVIEEDSEPGDDRHAPYHREHVIASMCERMIAFFLGVDWTNYENEAAALEGRKVM